MKAVVDAAGGTVNMCSFARGPYDIVLDMNVPSQEMMMGAMAMVKYLAQSATPFILN